MASLKKLFKKVTDIEPVHVQEHIQDKIHAFNSIVSILAQIQQGPPFQDHEMPYKTPPSALERLQLKLSNAFAHLAVANTDVVAAALMIVYPAGTLCYDVDARSEL